MNINHEIFNTLNQIKVPEGGLSLVPMTEGEGYAPEDDTAIVRDWTGDNSFVNPGVLAKVRKEGL